MAAFSHNQQQHGLDSVFLPSTTTTPSSTDFLHHHHHHHHVDQNQNAFILSHHQFYNLPPSSSSSHQHLSFHDQGIPVSDPLITNILINSENSEQTMNKQSTDSLSSLVDYKADSAAVGDQFTQNSITTNKRKKISDGSSSSLSSAHSKVLRENMKSKKQKKGSNGEEKGKKVHMGNKEEPSKGYIHVRARRGQATDSHSLAERIRREKISEKMKQLQALVPGCDKVTGKALMLDEIINYLQSLQHQVEFLSMKLSSFNPMFYDFGTDLDAFMLVPNEGMSGFMSNVQHCKNPTFISDSTSACTFTIPNNNFLLLDPSSRLFQQQMTTALSQENGGHLLWDIDEQRQRLIGLSGLMTNNNNNLGSFH